MLSSLFRGCLQQIDCAVEDGVFGRKRARPETGFLLGFRRLRWSFLGCIRFIFRNGAHHFRGRDAFFHDGFAAGIVIVRDREDQRRAIIQRDELLFGRQTEGTLSHDITAMIRSDRGGENFRGARRRGINQDGDGALPNDLLGLGRENLRRNCLAAKGRQHPRRNEKPGDRNGLGDMPAAAFPHIQNDLAYPLFFRIEKAIANFIRASGIERWDAQNENVGICLLGDDLRRGQLLAYQIYFFRRGLAPADHPNLNTRTRLAIQKIQTLANGHIASRKSTDGLENVAAANPRLCAWAIRQHGENDDVAVPLAERQTGFGSAGIGELLLVFVVLAWREVAGLRVEGFQHAVQGTSRHRTHIAIVNVILLYFLQHFRVHAERLVGFVVSCAAKNVTYACVTKDRHRYAKNSNASRSIHFSPFQKNCEYHYTTVKHWDASPIEKEAPRRTIQAYRTIVDDQTPIPIPSRV